MNRLNSKRAHLTALYRRGPFLSVRYSGQNALYTIDGRKNYVFHWPVIKQASAQNTLKIKKEITMMEDMEMNTVSDKMMALTREQIKQYLLVLKDDEDWKDKAINYLESLQRILE